MAAKKMQEIVEGIFMEPVPVILGDEVKIKYKGMLADSGAKKVFIHKGFGHVHSWDKVEDVPMRKTRDGGWSVKFKAEDPSSLNFCFHDEAENWDNNFGNNWSYQVHDGNPETH